ncbi:MAG TPA: polysaccharide deacetylase family protein [Gaiellaceae bacterium]|nr:polysaccharide deacetylase family protein [Gaiellaceae bacterium]
MTTRSGAESVLGRSFASVAQLAWRLSARRVGVALVYHRVAQQPRDPGTSLVHTVSADLLAAQLRHLKARYQIVPASELLRAAAARRRGARFPVAVTFDDDLESHNRLARPVLERLRVPATFFVSGASDQAPRWWEALEAAFVQERAVPPGVRALLARGGRRLCERSGLAEVAEAIEALPRGERDAVAGALRSWDRDEERMRADDVRELARARFAIGFHTLRHEPLPGLSDTDLERALAEGRDALAELAGRQVTAIAYPHGRADARVAAAARAAGYAVGFTGRPEAVRPCSDPLLLGRLEPSQTSAGRFALQIVRTLVARPRARFATGGRFPARRGPT